MAYYNFDRIKREYKTIVSQYKKLRPFGIDNFCPYVFLTAIENNIKIKSQSDHIKQRKIMMPKIYKKHLKLFLGGRAEMQKEDFNKWVKIDRPIRNVISSVKKLQKKYPIVIATMNRKKSIIRLLKKYGITPKVIADPTISPDKKKQLTYIKNKLKAKFDYIHFVDDQVKHFPNLLKLGVHCYLATWGYNTKKQQEDAKKIGAILLNQNNFYETFAKVK